jgi:hypothetical protein
MIEVYYSFSMVLVFWTAGMRELGQDQICLPPLS